MITHEITGAGEGMTEPDGAPLGKEEPFLVESETVNAIRARAPLEAVILDLMLIDGRAVMTDMTQEEVQEGIRARYGFDPYEVARRSREPHQDAPALPFVTGLYRTAEVAKAIAIRLIDAGLPVLVERLPEAPPDTLVLENPEGELSEGYEGPVWVVRTGYSAGDPAP